MPKIFRHPTGQAGCKVYSFKNGLLGVHLRNGMLKKKFQHDVSFT